MSCSPGLDFYGYLKLFQLLKPSGPVVQLKGSTFEKDRRACNSNRSCMRYNSSHLFWGWRFKFPWETGTILEVKQLLLFLGGMLVEPCLLKEIVWASISSLVQLAWCGQAGAMGPEPEIHSWGWQPLQAWCLLFQVLLENSSTHWLTYSLQLLLRCVRSPIVVAILRPLIWKVFPLWSFTPT